MGSKVSKLRSRAEALFAKFEQGEGMGFIDEAIVLDREALALCPSGHGERAAALIMLGTHLHGRYKQLGAARDLEEMIVLDREALGLRPEGHPHRSTSLINLAALLSIRYSKLGVIQDLEEAIVLGREALSLLPKGHAHHSTFLNNLAALLSTRYDKLGAIQDLEEAIVFDREALSLLLKGHLRSTFLSNLAAHLSIRYHKLGVIQDLEEAIALGREALSLRPEGHSDRSTSLNNLTTLLSTRYDKLGVIQDLVEAIVLGREALSLRPKGHPDRSASLNNLAALLSIQYDQLGVIQNLEEGIALGREALNLRPKGHLDRPSSLSNLAAHLSTRYDRLGVIQDLEEAIVLDREALSLLPKGHPDHSVFANNFAVHLSIRYHIFGVIRDLEDAIVLDREALSLRPKGHPHRTTSLSILAAHLSTRYDKLGVVQDLEDAIVLDREALSLLPKGHPHRTTSLSNLAAHLSIRYHKLGAIEDLGEAIILGQEALNLLPKGHRHCSSSLNNLAAYFSARYKKLGVIQDLEEAIALDREALRLRPNGNPDRSTSLSILALHLSTRYDKLRMIRDLEEGIVLGREALGLRPKGHPLRSTSLNILASFLHTRFSHSGQLQDKDELFSLYTQLTLLDQFVSSIDTAAAGAWTRVAEDFQHPSLLLAYETALRLLLQHLATLPSLPQHHVILKHLTSSLAVDAFSACLRNHAPTRAVELLEQGRGVFWSQLTRLQSPLQDVIEPGGKILADHFTRLVEEIRNTASDTSITDQHERLWHLNLEMQQVVADIRRLPDRSRFLLPPLFSDLQHAAVGGPVIILNASNYSCDALIILLDHDPVHIPLRITREIVLRLSTELRRSTVGAKKEDMTNQLGRFLRDVWDRIVSPIVDVLQTIVPFSSRIWWCPTSEFSLLPLHAAGPYRGGQRNLADLYISSYTPTLSALIRSRSHSRSDPDCGKIRFVAIGQAEAKGEKELGSVRTELDNIGWQVDSLTMFTRIDGEKSRIDRVIEEFGRNEWVHLACHGIPNPSRPFESAFALRDGHLTIQQIIQCELKDAEFAYLSACHTTVGDKDSPDEAIHLASAMQFIGFRSVIGTMWAVDDGKANEITSTFYKHMVDDSGRLDYTRAAMALNKTMKFVNVPFDQRILYVHLGA